MPLFANCYGREGTLEVQRARYGKVSRCSSCQIERQKLVSGQLYNPIKNKCMVLKDNIDLDGGAVIAENCEQAYRYNDGRSVW